MKTIQFVNVMMMTISALLLGACGAKSPEYYTAHPEEALQELKACQPKEIKIQLGDATCINAGEGYRAYLTARNKVIRAGERKAMQEWVDQNKR